MHREDDDYLQNALHYVMSHVLTLKKCESHHMNRMRVRKRPKRSFCSIIA